MKLLLDANLSFRLLASVASDFPGSRQVRGMGLERADDLSVWKYAKVNGFAIVTLDSDFFDLSLVRGFPPKVVWLRSLDTSTASIRSILVERKGEIQRFLDDPAAACLMLRNP